MASAPPGGPLVDIGEPMMNHGNTVRSIGGRQDPNRGLVVGQLERRIDEIRAGQLLSYAIRFTYDDA